MVRVSKPRYWGHGFDSHLELGKSSSSPVAKQTKRNLNQTMNLCLSTHTYRQKKKQNKTKQKNSKQQKIKTKHFIVQL